MRRSLILSICLFPLLGLLASAELPPHADSQPVAQTQPYAKPQLSADLGTPINLGESSTELSGQWKFHTGDNPVWAQTDFDDASWGNIDLTPPPDSQDPSGLVPGWTEQGYRGYSGYAWYRLHVDVQGARKRLALKMPDTFDDAYQVFVNGRLLGEFGKFTNHGVTAYGAFSREFPLPRDIRGGPMTIAVRMWMDSATPFNSPDAGGMREPPVLGHAPAISMDILADWYAGVHLVGSGFLEMFVLLLVIAVALTHFRIDRSDKAYLWLALVSLATLIGNALPLTVNFYNWIPQTVGVIVADVIMTPLRIGLWVIFWAYWFRVGPAPWLRRSIWSLMLLLAAGYLMLRAPLYGQVVPVRASVYLLPALLGIKLVMAALLFWVIFMGIRRRAEGWVALPAVLLSVVANYQRELRLVHVRTTFSFFGYHIGLGTASTMLSMILLTMMVSRRFLRSQRRQVRWGWEVEQAREVQRVLIPAKLPEVTGLSIEGEYLPAREVGGDFFQLIPNHADGSVLLVVGDVTGKGLCAGMLVALIVGVIHTAAHIDPNPAVVLNTLNERLCDRGHTSATCLVMRISPAGEVTVINAGHLPPYLNGKEMQLEGALPLGIMLGADYSIAHFHLEEGDTLMLMSDGVAEAQNAHGKLFGFDRIDHLLRQPITAAQLAHAAKDFGQEDDILVMRIERNALPRSVVHAEHSVALT